MFECHVYIHNHKDHLGKFDDKADDGVFLGYSRVTKEFRVFNIRRQEMEATYHITFSEDDDVISQSSTEGSGFDLKAYSDSDYAGCNLDRKSTSGGCQMLGGKYQANPKESHLVVVKRIFRYLKGTPNLGLCYPKGPGFDLKAYSDSKYAGCNLDRKITSGDVRYLEES
uniref:Uncharacterized mitochondrial protein AtMg00810-like n=1 Tax=Tanacetum cinerariifolium TaxID=118510 RepID=A0A6L2LUK2_TANCI|nr:uncharacterized mitochondrial protein AtMg00810-like [Tanacetum cinerariifolium]